LQAAAARPKWPWSATATTYSRSRRFMDNMIGRADHLSRDNRLDLSRVAAYRQPDEMAVTLKRHIGQL
jgi:hypothetical protein